MPALIEAVADGEEATVAPPAPVAPPARTGLLPLIAVLLAVVAALLAAIGLLVASRTVADARVAIETLRAQDMPRQVVVAAPPTEGNKPLTVADLDAAITALRRDIARAKAERGGASLAATVGSAQAELANRIDVISVKLDRIDKALNSRR